MENTKKRIFFFGGGGGVRGGQIGNFLSGIGKKNILFGIGIGAEFWPIRPQNLVIESPVTSGISQSNSLNSLSDCWRSKTTVL